MYGKRSSLNQSIFRFSLHYLNFLLHCEHAGTYNLHEYTVIVISTNVEAVKFVWKQKSFEKIRWKWTRKRLILPETGSEKL